MATLKGGYRVADGKRVPSVTTIIGKFKESGALIKWAYRMGREHEHAALTGGDDPGDLYAVTKKAADAGSIAHDLIEDHVLAGEVQTEVREAWKEAQDTVLDLAWNSYKQFQQWYKNTSLEVISTEEHLVSEEYRFGGTYDALGKDSEGRIVLVDWKTSNAVYSDYLCQLGGYALLLEECKGIKVEGFHLLRVRKETADFSHHYWEELEEGKRAFLLMRELYDITYRLSKRT